MEGIPVYPEDLGSSFRLGKKWWPIHTLTNLFTKDEIIENRYCDEGEKNGIADIRKRLGLVSDESCGHISALILKNGRRKLDQKKNKLSFLTWILEIQQRPPIMKDQIIYPVYSNGWAQYSPKEEERKRWRSIVKLEHLLPTFFQSVARAVDPTWRIHSSSKFHTDIIIWEQPAS